jgi:hypothetical protein
MLNFIQLDPMRFDPSSEICQYNANSFENIFKPDKVAGMDGSNRKDFNNPVNLLVEIARNEKVKCIALMISPENKTMQNICQKLGFGLNPSTEIGMIEALIEF